MRLELEGKIILIPGGSKGIGLACAKAFLASAHASYVSGTIITMDGLQNPII
jgi:NAD(P)-dependent dehydrogenase (short-subunit alcohol dehydrogenase family)